MLRQIDHFIGGTAVAAGERSGDIFNPSAGEVQATVRLGTAADLQKALNVIKHKPDAEVVDQIVEKLDVDKDGFVELEHVVGLVREEGLGESHSFISVATL